VLHQDVDKAIDEVQPTLEQERERAIDEILAVFADSDPARALRHVAHSAFMRGAWAGRASSATALCDLQERDQQGVMDLLAANKAARADQGRRS